MTSESRPTVAVVGLGKIGLPLAVQIAASGHRTIGCDRSDDVVDSVGRGTAPFPGEPMLEERLASAVSAGNLTATTDTSAAVADADIVVVVVPLVVDVDRRPDFRALDAATRDVGRGLRRGSLVIYETTMPVGVTRNRCGTLLEEVSQLRVGHDFALAYSPERVSSGRVFGDLRRYPKLVGGVDESSEEQAAEFYAGVLEFDDRPDLTRPNGVWRMGGTEAAELAKLAETTYRDINIAFANQLAVFAEETGIDVHDVIAAANSQPFSHIHSPGVAVGGHCIPVYPWFYLEGHPDAALPREARRINEAMPARAVRTLADRLGDLAGRRVAVLGAAYRGGVKETAFSGVWPIVSMLEDRRAEVLVHDPMYAHDELETLGLTPYELGQPCDGAILQADHPEYARLSPSELPGCKVIYDGRKMLDLAAWSAAGVDVRAVGTP